MQKKKSTFVIGKKEEVEKKELQEFKRKNKQTKNKSTYNTRNQASAGLVKISASHKKKKELFDEEHTFTLSTVCRR